MLRKNWLKFSTLSVYLILLFSLVVALPIYAVDIYSIRWSDVPGLAIDVPPYIPESIGDGAYLMFLQDYLITYFICIFIIIHNVIYLRKVNKNNWFTSFFPFLCENIKIQYSFAYKMKLIAFICTYIIVVPIFITGIVFQFIFNSFGYLLLRRISTPIISWATCTILSLITLFFICILVFQDGKKLFLVTKQNKSANKSFTYWIK
ncbi:hypothetical protein U5U50_02840 [Mycoplasma sp. 888]|uniref:hypothetical protein n=1 Tax=Mycoplasma sp. 888 TaxID=3108483 RepID=UPI002D780E80|nr:hypothetical protein [Mycoplasma sp. 888]WRQ25716.1 hypothetical protein U5U50_02840 [Mycoplasma sp. 888]